MKIHQFIEQKMLTSTGIGYWATLKALVWAQWAALMCPGTFEKEGHIIENFVQNGAFRVFLGGIFQVLIGFCLILVGFVASLLILAIFLGSPLFALWIYVFSRVKARLFMRDLTKQADKLSKGRKHGA